MAKSKTAAEAFYGKTDTKAGMVHMKREPMPAEQIAPETSKEAGPQYGYGTCLNLDKEDLEKLNLTGADAGDEVHFTAVGKVTRATRSAMANGKHQNEHQSAELQITHIKIERVEPRDEEARAERAGADEVEE